MHESGGKEEADLRKRQAKEACPNQFKEDFTNDNRERPVPDCRMRCEVRVVRKNKVAGPKGYRRT